MPLHHTGDNIREIVQNVDEWEIPPSKISATLTDIGSNMIAAFQPQVVDYGDDDTGDDQPDQDMESGDTNFSLLVEDFEEKKTMKLHSVD